MCCFTMQYNAVQNLTAISASHTTEMVLTENITNFRCLHWTDECIDVLNVFVPQKPRVLYPWDNATVNPGNDDLHNCPRLTPSVIPSMEGLSVRAEPAVCRELLVCF